MLFWVLGGGEGGFWWWVMGWEISRGWGDDSVLVLAGGGGFLVVVRVDYGLGDFWLLLPVPLNII